MQVCLPKFDQVADFLLRQTEDRGDEGNGISDNGRLLRVVGCAETDSQEDGGDDDEEQGNRQSGGHDASLCWELPLGRPKEIHLARCW